jgi:hypothetical protein
MAFKGKVVSGTPVISTKFANRGGFDKGRLGSDSVPGPMKGAPLINSKKIDDYDVRKSTYHAGHGDIPGGYNDIPAVALGAQPNGPQSKPLDAVLPRSREMPHAAADRGKSDEIAHADPSMGLGDRPTGVVGGGG